MNINDVFSWADHLEMVEYHWLRFFQKTDGFWGNVHWNPVESPSPKLTKTKLP
jgi:hypothetical protein